MIKLTSQEIQLINFFEKKTKARVKDCINEEEGITFIVEKGDIGLAIGKGGQKIKKIKDEIGKEIHVYEYADNEADFIKNLFFPIKIDKVEINGKEAKVFIDPKQKKRAIGKQGKKINNVKKIIIRHYDIQNIKIV